MVAAPPADTTPALTVSATAEDVQPARTAETNNDAKRTLGDVAVHRVDNNSNLGSHLC